MQSGSLKTENPVMHKRREKIYAELPAIYEFLMRKVNYKTWAEYLATIVDDYVPSNSKVLELAAGNCKLANYFIYFYPNLITTDLSKNMLLSDKKNLAPKICCDMKSLPFKTKFDLIYSTFDSVNYLMSKKDLFIMFKEVASVLSDRGIYTFDASLENNSFVHTRIPVREGHFKGIYFQQHSEYNKNSRIHTNTFEISLKTGEVVSEIHRQKIYPFETYFDVIEKAGMYVLKCYNGFTLTDGNRESERVQFIIKKIV